MSSLPGRSRVSFGYNKHINRQNARLKSTPKAFQNYPEEQYADFHEPAQSDQGRKRSREYVQARVCEG